MNKNSLIFRRAAWVAVLALMLQVLMPLLHPAMAAGISSVNGLRICSIAKTGDNGKEAPQKIPSCLICFGIHHHSGSLAAPPNIALTYIASLSFVLTTPSNAAVIVVSAVSSAQPRAPPALA